MQVLAQQERYSVGSGDELDALLAGCGVYRPQTALIAIDGRDRARWLNGMVTNNIRDLAPGHGVYAFVLNPQGHILGDLYVFNSGESMVAELKRSEADRLLQIFRRYIIMDKVEIVERGNWSGPKSREALSTLGLGQDLGALQFVNLQWRGTAVALVRGDNPCVPNYELWTPAEQSEAAWDQLLSAGAVPVSQETVETFRILCGIPKVSQDIRERTLPQETGQERALNFTKGCYIGQEIVERIRSRGAVHRALVGFEIESQAPEVGSKVQSDGKDVGEITSIMNARIKGKRLALGYLRKEYLMPDKVLKAGEALVKATTLPFTGVFE
jgi:folate-binding protein YgfZ